MVRRINGHSWMRSQSLLHKTVAGTEMASLSTEVSPPPNRTGPCAPSAHIEKASSWLLLTRTNQGTNKPSRNKFNEHSIKTYSEDPPHFPNRFNPQLPRCYPSPPSSMPASFSLLYVVPYGWRFSDFHYQRTGRSNDEGRCSSHVQ